MTRAALMVPADLKSRYPWLAAELTIILGPLAFGSAIYLLYRPKTIIALKLLAAIGLEQFCDRMRVFLQVALPIGRGPLLYSVPQGLWAFSFTYVVLWIWRPMPNHPLALLSVICSLIVIQGGEIAQLSFLPGTFDFTDLIYNAIGIALAWGAAHARRNRSQIS